MELAQDLFPKESERRKPDLPLISISPELYESYKGTIQSNN